MKKRILSAVLSAAMLGTSVYSVPFVSALTSEETHTPGIEMWANPSGTFRCIEGVSFDDLITSFGEGSFVYRYSNNKKAIVVTPEGKTYHFSNSNVWGLSYSVVTMREGTEPPVSEINEKIGAGDDLKVKFYKYADGNEYRFYISGEEYADTVLDILKNNKDVVSIENRREITEDEFRLESLYVSTELTEDEFKKQYGAFDLTSFEELGGSLSDDKKEQGYTLGFTFNDYKCTPELYEELIKLDNSGVKYEITPLLAMNSGGYTVAEMAEPIYKASGSDKSDVLIGDVDASGTIDVSDLTELSLALIGDKEFTAEQKKSADVDGDEAVTLADLAKLQQYLSKKIDKL